MKFKKKLKRAGSSKVANLIKIYSIDDSKTDEQWLELFSKKFEKPDYQCLVYKKMMVVVDMTLISYHSIQEIAKLIDDPIQYTIPESDKLAGDNVQDLKKTEKKSK